MGPHTGRCKGLQYSGLCELRSGLAGCSLLGRGLEGAGGGRWQVAGMQEEEVHPDSLVLVITIGKC